MSQRYLMCPPEAFQVSYAINPWMKGNLGRTDPKRARDQYDSLTEAIRSAGGEVFEIQQEKDLPDQVFTANVAAIVGQDALISYFAFEERRREADIACRWLKEMGFQIHQLPEGVAMEGTGDLLRDTENPWFWAGYGHRSSLLSHRAAAEALNYEIVTLRLGSQRFYHLDVCLAPLPRGIVMYYPGAFDDASVHLIETRVPQDKRIVVSERDALNFACNAISCGDSVILYRASEELKERLAEKNLQVIEINLDEFLLAGGSARCMVLPLDEPRLPEGKARHGLVSEELLLEGHLLDFSVLAKCLDHITANGCEFEVLEFRPGLKPRDFSKARLRVVAPNAALLSEVSAWVKELAMRSTALKEPAGA